MENKKKQMHGKKNMENMEFSRTKKEPFNKNGPTDSHVRTCFALHFHEKCRGGH